MLTGVLAGVIGVLKAPSVKLLKTSCLYIRKKKMYTEVYAIKSHR